MKTLKIILLFGAIVSLFLFVRCDDDALFNDTQGLEVTAQKGGRPTTETASNNLSFPVIWSDDFEKTLPGIYNTYSLNGSWWYVWGVDPIDPQAPIFSCEPDPLDPTKCVGGKTPGDGVSVVYKAYLQKDAKNQWQAFNATQVEQLFVDQIDWGDDLESVNWSLTSQVRCEVVLYETLSGKTFMRGEVPTTLPQYPQFPMRHVSGWGIDEVHGLATPMDASVPTPAYDLVPGDMATVYSHNARFTIQKLNVTNLSELTGKLEWKPLEGWTEIEGTVENLVSLPIFNKAVYQALDGPGSYSAEINVKGKVIYGYTWKVRNLNQGTGYYRLTFSLDDVDGTPAELNTFFDANTKILVAEEVTTEADDGSSGGTAVMDWANNLTYMDILIVNKGSGRR